MNNIIMSRRLQKLLSGGSKECLEKSLKKTLEEATKMCKDTAPVDTGKLREGITSQQSSLEGKILSAVDYWVYVNYGTSSITPQPFVSDTANEIPSLFDKNFKNEFENM